MSSTIVNATYRERIRRNGYSHLEPLNCSSRRKKALISFVQCCMSLLTSAATRPNRLCSRFAATLTGRASERGVYAAETSASTSVTGIRKISALQSLCGLKSALPWREGARIRPLSSGVTDRA